ncbi:MAG TPA: hypothetical protein VKB48_02705 [Candidatus Acidoferrum sp.]|nr:hypothetical protein [Candidatus Acidoferrum sp.]
MSRTWIFGVLTAAVLGAGCLAQAQEPPPGPPPHHGFPGHMGERMEILGFEEMHPGKVVTGAPYSAVRVREEAQTLSDGTAINRKIQTSVFRDSQGRVRREVTMPTIGPLAASNQAQTFIVIHDPVAGTAYELHPDEKTAVQLRSHAGGKKNPDELQGKFDAFVQQEIANGTLKKEDIGTQTISGLSAQGTRYTRTIPAGQIGNDKPILVTDEVWYSPDLQIVVKNTHTDPRFGTRTSTVTNIQRQEPAATLFTVPTGYTVTQGRRGPRGMRRGGGAAPTEDAPPPPGE